MFWVLFFIILLCSYIRLTGNIVLLAFNVICIKMIHQYMCLFIGQYLTSPTTSDQSGLLTSGIAGLIIGLLSIIVAVSFVVYRRKFYLGLFNDKYWDVYSNYDIHHYNQSRWRYLNLDKKHTLQMYWFDHDPYTELTTF